MSRNRQFKRAGGDPSAARPVAVAEDAGLWRVDVETSVGWKTLTVPHVTGATESGILDRAIALAYQDPRVRFILDTRPPSRLRKTVDGPAPRVVGLSA